MKWLDKFKRNKGSVYNRETLSDVTTIFVGGYTWVKAETLLDDYIPQVYHAIEAQPGFPTAIYVKAFENAIREIDKETINVESQRILGE